MEKFLKKIEEDLQHKVLHCATGHSIIKPFNKIYDKVRDRPKNLNSINTNFNKNTKIYSDGEESIYAKIIAQFLEEEKLLSLEQSSEWFKICLGKNLSTSSLHKAILIPT